MCGHYISTELALFAQEQQQEQQQQQQGQQHWSFLKVTFGTHSLWWSPKFGVSQFYIQGGEVCALHPGTVLGVAGQGWCCTYCTSSF